ncbi:mitochondrial ribosomal protein subunit-domain-containing protein [Boeremia exigua]|uniref:mitochondrial ribosomal protein subunit-domain-containing protein n=1 Tax=Boeremia exigua TaxID=749465 RepID=UPI001E8CAFDF|nr:mitochondrial ribosomal protein subunit-domain-containing protein [Boeremia exigua]KAH6611843.1 mitochondrial ribosomal protein subunit-domain-containing protein [Boeremia exigua]
MALRQSASPTAHLLRNSRLFSLPTPLPRPVVGETSGAGVTKASDSATLPYPTHQAIATTKSSLARGDWGLKRNLPARSRMLQTSDPVLRVTQLDTIEHVTDFDSAADHVRTRQKWEQMGIPMMKGLQHLQGRDMTGPPPTSAFETRDDTTAYNTTGLDQAGLFLRALRDNMHARTKQEKQLRRPLPFAPHPPPPVSADVHNTRRWKHQGPWLPSQSAAEFVAYLDRELAKHRDAFSAHLTEFAKNEIYTTRAAAAARSGDVPPIDPAEAAAWQSAREASWADISPADIAATIRALRVETANNPISSRLVQRLIIPFLRLPTLRLKHRSYQQNATGGDFARFAFDSETAPLSTHPSAGLTYLRTRAHVSSHPLLGPQARPPPVAARVLQPRVTAHGKEAYARLGVAGFVANDQLRADPSAKSRVPARDVETLDTETPGGRKLFVSPLYGAVRNDGRVALKLLRAQGAEVAVARGEMEDRPPVRDARGSDGGRGFEGLLGRNGGGRKWKLRGREESEGEEGRSVLGEGSAQGREFSRLMGMDGGSEETRCAPPRADTHRNPASPQSVSDSQRLHTTPTPPLHRIDAVSLATAAAQLPSALRPPRLSLHAPIPPPQSSVLSPRHPPPALPRVPRTSSHPSIIRGARTRVPLSIDHPFSTPQSAVHGLKGRVQCAVLCGSCSLGRVGGVRQGVRCEVLGIRLGLGGLGMREWLGGGDWRRLGKGVA